MSFFTNSHDVKRHRVGVWHTEEDNAKSPSKVLSEGTREVVRKIEKVFEKSAKKEKAIQTEKMLD